MLERAKSLRTHQTDAELRLWFHLRAHRFMEQVEYDRRRDAYLHSEGFTVLRFWNNQVLCETDAALSSSPSPASGRGEVA